MNQFQSNFNPGYSNFGYPQPNYPQFATQQISGPQIKSNRILVTGLQEALSKPCDFNSEMYYWDQSKPVIYVIRTNDRGIKEWAEIPYTISNQLDSTPATKAELNELRSEFAKLKGIIAGERNPRDGQEVTADVEQSIR